MTRAAKLAIFLVLALALYPVITTGGWLDQWLGLWWPFVIPLVPLSMAIYHYSLRVRRPAGGAYSP